MIPSSANCGCECSESSTPVTPTGGATGTAGCSGANVACLTVVNGAVTGISERVLPGISGATGSAGCSSYNVPCIAVSNGAVTTISDRSLNIGTVGPYNVPAAGDAASGEVVLGSDSRLTNSRTPTAHASTHAVAGSDPITIAQSQVTNLTTDLALKAPLSSPTFTGTPAAPTAPADTNTTQLATTAYVIGQASATNPSALGSVSPGSSSKFSRGDHVHPRQITALGSEVSGLLPFANLTNATAGSVLLGRGSSGSGAFQEITLGTNLSMSGTTLNATSGSSDGNHCAYTFYDSVGVSQNVTANALVQPFPDSAEPAQVILDFVPTSIRMTFRLLGATPGAGSGAYLGLQSSTSGSPGTWVDTGIRCPITVTQVLTVVTDKVNVVLSGTPLYFRLITYCNTVGPTESITIRMCSVTFIK